jgi:hypothetical protein
LQRVLRGQPPRVDAQQRVRLDTLQGFKVENISFYFILFYFYFFFKKRGCPGSGANPGPLDFIYVLIFTTLPLSHSGSPSFDFKGYLHETSKFGRTTQKNEEL